MIGKGIVRFHAVYWPAILLSAQEPLPTTIFVHDYLTVDGQKISKSLGTAIDPLWVVERYGADALRWWFLRDVPRKGDADFRRELIAARGNELADGLGNLVNRTIALVSRHAHGWLAAPAEWPVEAEPLRRQSDELPAAIDAALARFDLRGATTALWDVVDEANRFVSATRPWELAKAAATGDRQASERLDAVLAVLLAVCAVIATELSPFLPAAAERIAGALADLDGQRDAASSRSSSRPPRTGRGATAASGSGAACG